MLKGFRKYNKIAIIYNEIYKTAHFYSIVILL